MSVILGGRDLPDAADLGGSPSISRVGLDRDAIEQGLQAGADRVVVVNPLGLREATVPLLAHSLLEARLATVVTAVFACQSVSSADVLRWCDETERFGSAGASLELPLAAGAVAPGYVRRTVAGEVSGLGQAVVAAAPLVASELVSNALQHVGDGRFELATDGDEVRLSVYDTQPLSWPTLTEVDPLAEAGRGLGIVAALAQAWGITAGRLEKAVWCELR